MNCAIVICVDDFGCHPGVDAAVLDLAAKRRITATSCMIGGPSWRSGSAALRDTDPAMLDAGLHLDLTRYTIDPSLRHPLPFWMAASMAHLPSPRRLRTEIDAQLDAFEDAMGRPPSHLDGHEHVHQFPIVRDVVIEALAARYADRLPWLRRTRRTPRLPHRFKAWVIDTMGADALSRLALRQGFRQNAHMVGVYDFSGGAGRYRALLRRWLHAASQGDLLLCHPMCDLAADAMAPPFPSHHDARLAEFEVFASAAFDDLLLEEGVSVAPLRSLAGN